MAIDQLDSPGGDTTQLNCCVLAAGDLLWFNQTTLQLDFANPGAVPSPEAPFPYRRLASAFRTNATQSYVYHQLNESTFVEDVWVESGFWLPSTNISVKT